VKTWRRKEKQTLVVLFVVAVRSKEDEVHDFWKEGLL